jgi:hypothetical protein
VVNGDECGEVGGDFTMMTITSLPFKRYGTKDWQSPKEYILPEDLFVEQWVVPTGTTVKLKTSVNFGYCILAEGTKDKRGFLIPQRLFRY